MSGKITHPKIRYGVKSNVVFQKIKNTQQKIDIFNIDLLLDGEKLQSYPLETRG